MNGHGAILLANPHPCRGRRRGSADATAPAWHAITSVNWAPDRWTTPPICNGIELTIGCVQAADVPADKD